jgi:hypothetical protein
MKKPKDKVLDKLQEMSIGIIRRFEIKTEIYSVGMEKNTIYLSLPK